MQRLGSILSSTWTGFAVLAVCLGFFADFPVGRPKLEASVSTVLPIGAALLPYLAFGGSIYGGGLILAWVYRHIVDRVNDGTSVRKFQALAVRIGKCNSALIAHLESWPLRSRIYGETSYASRLIAELQFVLEQLADLGIPVPPLGDIDIGEHGQPLVAYLATMQTYAKNGELRRARENDFWANWFAEES